MKGGDTVTLFGIKHLTSYLVNKFVGDGPLKPIDKAYRRPKAALIFSQHTFPVKNA
jgi:hypothetical protein